METLKYGFLGGGSMASALISGLLMSGVPVGHIAVTVRSTESVDRLKVTYPGIITSTNNMDAITGRDIILLAVKPQVAPSAILPFVGGLNTNQIVMSVMAGYDLRKLSELLNKHSRIVRVMPNTPSLIGKGATVYCPAEGCSEEDIKKCEEVLSAVGVCCRVPEFTFNAATAVSGCGPAYVYMFIEAMADAGVANGLPRSIALKLAAQTVMGAGAMVLETEKHPGVLKDNVCSPGGVTICGVTALEESGLRGTVIRGVKAAAAKADEMTSK